MHQQGCARSTSKGPNNQKYLANLSNFELVYLVEAISDVRNGGRKSFLDHLRHKPGGGVILEVRNDSQDPIS